MQVVPPDLTCHKPWLSATAHRFCKQTTKNSSLPHQEVRHRQWARSPGCSTPAVGSNSLSALWQQKQPGPAPSRHHHHHLPPSCSATGMMSFWPGSIWFHAPCQIFWPHLWIWSQTLTELVQGMPKKSAHPQHPFSKRSDGRYNEVAGKGINYWPANTTLLWKEN